jgi:hypothetical protein
VIRFANVPQNFRSVEIQCQTKPQSNWTGGEAGFHLRTYLYFNPDERSIEYLTGDGTGFLPTR